MDEYTSGPIACGVPFGLFLHSKVHQEETKSHDDAGLFVNAYPSSLFERNREVSERLFMELDLDSRTLSMNFRHRRWLGERQAMADRIDRATGNTKRWYRFVTCGQEGRIEATEHGQKWRVVCLKCHDRFCEPCQEERAWHARRKLRRIMGNGFHRMITLTLADENGQLRDLLTHLNESFSRLRRSEFWRRTVAGGAWFQEVTRGKEGDHWHVHAHAITHGTWVDTSELSAAWATASNGSFVVHVRAVDEDSDGAMYAAKYATKGINRGTIARPEDWEECIQAFAGARLIGTFGDWWRVDLNEDELEKQTWKDLGSIGECTRAYIRGEAWASRFLRTLKTQVIVRGGRVIYCRDH